MKMENEYSDEIKSFMERCLNADLIRLEICDFKAILSCGKPSFTRPAVPKGAILLIEAEDFDKAENICFNIVEEMPDDANIVWGVIKSPVTKVTALYVS